MIDIKYVKSAKIVFFSIIVLSIIVLLGEVPMPNKSKSLNDNFFGYHYFLLRNHISINALLSE